MFVFFRFLGWRSGDGCENSGEWEDARGGTDDRDRRMDGDPGRRKYGSSDELTPSIESGGRWAHAGGNDVKSALDPWKRQDAPV